MRVHRSTFAPSVALTIAAWCAGVAAAAPVWNFSRLTGAGEEPSADRRIVVFSPGLPAAERAAAVARAGGRVLNRLDLIRAVTAVVPADRLAAVRGQPGVLRVDEDITVEALVVHGSGKPAGGGEVQPPQQTPWGVARIKAPDAWTGSRGGGVKVAVLDTGIDSSHPDLADNIKGGINTINPAKSHKDDNGHGTHVAGIIAALDNAIGVAGGGPQAHLYSVKALNRNGSGFLSDIIEGLEWSVNNGMQVVNMSLGSSSDNLSFRDAVVQAYGAGIVLVAAAGNSGGGAVSFPAKYPEVVAVSAANSADALASFSSVGPEVDLIAPGQEVLSTYLGKAYATMSGTSMAAPHAAAAAALKIAQSPSWTHVQVIDALKSTADPLPGLSAEQQGSGMLDCPELVALALTAN